MVVLASDDSVTPVGEQHAEVQRAQHHDKLKNNSWHRDWEQHSFFVSLSISIDLFLDDIVSYGFLSTSFPFRSG